LIQHNGIAPIKSYQMNSLFATCETCLRTEGKHFRQLHMKCKNLMSTAMRRAKARGPQLTAKP